MQAGEKVTQCWRLLHAEELQSGLYNVSSKTQLELIIQTVARPIIQKVVMLKVTTLECIFWLLATIRISKTFVGWRHLHLMKNATF